jgi:hypothetical protein
MWSVVLRAEEQKLQVSGNKEMRKYVGTRRVK